VRASAAVEAVTSDSCRCLAGTEIGAILTGLGALFTFLGIVMFLDRGLLAIGNLLFLSGITLVLGFQRTGRFLFQRQKARGTACFLGGILLVLIGWAFIGLIVQAFGFINLFGDFFPVAIAFAKRLPFVGRIAELPGIKWVLEKVGGGEMLPV
jgi:vesicle transport protein GOT1